MFGTSGAGGHRILFSNPPLRRVFIVSSLGRFGYAVLPLCLLFSIAQGSGSFRTAALASAAFGLGGLVMPVEARLLDQHGQRRVLPLLGGWFTAFLITVWGATHLFQISPEWWILLCALGGAGAPSLGPSMRAQWREATDEPLRSVAYSVDAIVEEILFLVGPWRRQVTVLLLPRLPLVVACALFPQLWLIAAAFVLTSFLTAPTFVVGYAAGDQESDPDRHTEASTWVTTASNLGMSAGTAVAGWFHGMQLDGAVFAVAAGLILAALLLALRCGRGIPGPCG